MFKVVRYLFLTSVITLISISLVNVSVAQTITGQVFDDRNTNGLRDDPTQETGLAGVYVTAYYSATAINPIAATAITNSAGSYTLAVGVGVSVRVEFTNWPTGYAESFRGTDNGTAIQFAAGGASNISLGLSTSQAIEIGNRVWIDRNRNGFQEPQEAVLAGVSVWLYTSDGSILLAKTKTNAAGEYYFSNVAHQPTTTWVSSVTGLLSNTAYRLVFGAEQYDVETRLMKVGSRTYWPTTPKQYNRSAATAQTDSDVWFDYDTDPEVRPTIFFTTGLAGATNHTLDAGFFWSPPIDDPCASNAECVPIEAKILYRN